MERFLGFGRSMEKKPQTSREMVQTILDAFQIKSVQLAKMMEIDQATLSRWCAGRGRLNTKAILVLHEFWQQATQLTKPVEKKMITLPATDVYRQLALDVLDKARQELKRNVARREKLIAKMQDELFRAEKLNQLDIDKPIFGELQQRHWALFKVQAKGTGTYPSELFHLQLQIARNQMAMRYLGRILREGLRKT